MAVLNRRAKDLNKAIHEGIEKSVLSRHCMVLHSGKEKALVVGMVSKCISE